jgi:poly(hydroxyalkanoate) depolymerase family esterase
MGRGVGEARYGEASLPDGSVGRLKEWGLCMSSLGGRGWAPLRLAVRRRLRRTNRPTEVGRWDQFVEKGPHGSRSYAVYTPPGLRPGAAVPLVLVLHGCNQSAKDAALGTDVNAYAERAGFVALYPQQSAADNLRKCWNWFQPRHQSRGFGEPAAIARITERVLRGRGGVRLDRDRVHVMGLSAGGAMAAILAATYPDIYASVGIHSAPQFGAARSPVTALLAMRSGGPDPERQGRLAHAAMGPRARVVPVIVFQGDADRTVWVGNGDTVARQWLTTSRLANRDGSEYDFARPHASTAGRAPGGLSYRVRSWSDKAGRPVLQYWLVSGLAHAWSGGASAGSYTDPRGPSATEAMCDFFAQSVMEPSVAMAGPAARGGVSGARVLMKRVRDIGRSGSGKVTNPDRRPG